MARAVDSIDLTGELTGPDLALLDEALDAISEGLRLAVVRLVGRGRPRAGIETRAFVCVRLNEVGAQTRHAFLLKLGEPEALLDEFGKWSRHLFPRTPVMLRPHGHVLLMELIGSPYVPFADVARSHSGMLRSGLAALSREWLADLHGHYRATDEGWPSRSRTTHAALFGIGGGRGPRIDEGDRRMARTTVATQLADPWMGQTVDDVERGYSVPNWVAALIDGRRLPGRHRPCELPYGLIHGDLNLDNLFLTAEALSTGGARAARRADPETARQRVALIDYERLGVGCVFDDLARLECELLISAMPVLRGRAPFADTALMLVAACWPWDLAGPKPVGFAAWERDVCAAIAELRATAVEIAARAAGDDRDAFERGYFACLLGRAFSYLHYRHVLPEQRPRAAELCLLLGARLFDEQGAVERPRFPDLLRPVGSAGASAHDCDLHGHLLDGTQGASAVCVRSERVGDVEVSADLSIEAVAGETAKVGILKGGPPGDEARVWVSVSEGTWRLRLERLLGADPHCSVVLPESPLGRPVELRLACTGSLTRASVRVDDGNLLKTDMRFQAPGGHVHVKAEGCRVRLRSLRAVV